jgi:hypothetical protein
VCVSGECVEPGQPCTDSFDCGLDAFCEPTIGQCLPQFDPVTCEVIPDFGSFEPLLEWSWTSSAVEPAYVHSVSAPIVVDLDGAGSPEVVVNTTTGGFLGQQGRLRALAGHNGAEVWTNTDTPLQSAAGLAAGDIDADGFPEVLAITFDQRLAAFEHDGSTKWISAQAMSGIGTAGPSIADLDGDGSPEIVVGAAVFDASGAVDWDHGASAGTNAGYPGGFTAIADVDLDGEPEVVPGGLVYGPAGALERTLGSDGYPAVANFDDDPQPEIVVVSNGWVAFYDGQTGAQDWPAVGIPGGGRGGPPTVADFDGDGDPEVGVAGGSSYLVIDPDGQPQVRWTSPTQDASSNVTGSSVFDFEGDGQHEVVYADECYLRVYDGADGTVRMEVPNTSGTGHEYPLVADVDGDGNSELVVVANSWSCAHGHDLHGVFVYGDTHDRWVPTRRIWNQHAYHVTNVASDGAIPAVESNSWQVPSLNNYRTNVQGEGVFNAPDLTVDLAVSASYCNQPMILTATVMNIGSLGVPAGLAVAFFAGTSPDPGSLIAVAHTLTSLLPGQSEVVTAEFQPPGSQSGPYDFVVMVDYDETDPDGAARECLEDNNTASVTGVTCGMVP